MNVSWIERTQKTIDKLRAIKEKRDADRLEIITGMRFSEIMSQFTREELLEMSDTLIDMVAQFLEYDMKITDYGMQKGLGKQRDEQQNRFVI